MSLNLTKLSALLLLPACFAFAQKGEGPLDPAPPKDGKTPDQIIQVVAQKEAQFQRARENYIYKQDVRVDELDGDTVVGNYHEAADVGFDGEGRRLVTVTFAPPSTLQKVQMTKEDIDDIENQFPFVITPETMQVYDVKYLGHQKVDELGTYVFDLNPVRMEKGKRYFKGRVWVDDQDLMIVKTSGLGVPNPKENQPVPFTTWREQIDGKYWFPTYTSGQADIKAFGRHHEVMDSTPIKEIVKYTDYRQFKSTSSITFGSEADDSQPPQQNGQPAPQSTPPPTAPKKP